MDRCLVYPAILMAVVAALYYNSLECEFVFDDISAIKDNKDLRPESPIMNIFWNDFWGTPMHKEKSHKSYRPLCVLTFRLNYAFSELDPMSYHLVNVVLHGIVCVLFLWVCEMFLPPAPSFLAAMMFAVHPIHTEAVTGVVGRAELLSSIFYLWALTTYSKCTGKRKNTDWRKLIQTVVLVSIAMLCKEQGITIIGVCCVYEIFIAQKMTFADCVEVLLSILKGKPKISDWLKDAIVRSVFLVSSTVLLLVARIKVMGAQLPVFTRFDNPASVAPVPARHLTLNYLLPVNAWLLLNPSQLCCDWTMGTIPLIESYFDPRNIATLAFYVSLGFLVKLAMVGKGPRIRALIMSLSLIVFPFIPATNLFFPVGFVVAERILYAPSMGYCMLVALGFHLLADHKRLKPFLWLGMSLLLVTHSVKTVTRNSDWKTEYSIFMAALKVNRQNAKLFNNVGHALENKQNYGEALGYFMEAAQVQPDDIGAHINVGRTMNHLERFKEAEHAYRTALALLPPVIPGQSYTARVAPNHLNVFVNLGNLISKDESRLLEADALYRTAISMRADFTQAYMNRGDILMKLNRSEEAQEQYHIALRYEDDNADLYYNLGVVLLEKGQHAEAYKKFEKALTIDPNHKQTLFNSAVLIQEIGDVKLRPEAYKRLHKVMIHEPDNEKIFFNLGMLSMDDKKFPEAKKWFDKAIELKEDFRSSLFNQALLLANDMQQPLDAVPYLKQLFKFYPTHSKGLILMGDININHLKDLDAAEENFLSILKHEPENVQANHNLCVVYVEKGMLVQAEKCLFNVHQMAPHEEYIKQHLNIVRHRIYKAQQKQKEEREAQNSQKKQEAAKEQFEKPEIHQNSGSGAAPSPQSTSEE